MKIGYARVSTEEQNLDLQLDALLRAGCEKIYQEKVSGMKTQRAELGKLLAHLRAGDVLMIWKLDRLGRSLPHLVELTHELLEKEVGLQSLSDPIDTTTAQGRLVFNIFASLAQFERDLIRERTMAGLASARSRGRLGGRKKGLSEKAQKTALIAEALYKQKQLPVMDLCKQLSISKPTLYRYLRSRGVPIK
ncbi:recombinase family protein [Rhodocytophaga rosea]|uniref:Recombinase family protein n=1 Tax=Rhodocytophaga rosea TaxID=2704465 RepID=A0A6C0GBH7_9BACT|nr:recombinase family protein [Rhodocytophaga rosea]QHT65238.1 recombinase family protein [Rhodocytophaga rosea]